MLGSFGGKSAKKEIIERTRVPAQTVAFVGGTSQQPVIEWKVMLPTVDKADGWMVANLQGSETNARVRHLDTDTALAKIEADAQRVYTFEEAVEILGVWEYAQMREGRVIAQGNDESDLGENHFKRRVHDRGLMMDAYGRLARTVAGVPMQTGTYRMDDLRDAASSQNLPVVPQKGGLTRVWQRATGARPELMELHAALSQTDQRWPVVEAFLGQHYPLLRLDAIAPELREDFCEELAEWVRDIAESQHEIHDGLYAIPRRGAWLAGGEVLQYVPAVSGIASMVAFVSMIGIGFAAWDVISGLHDTKSSEKDLQRDFLTIDTIKDRFSHAAYLKKLAKQAKKEARRAARGKGPKNKGPEL